MEYVTVSAKIPKKLKEIMDELGIKPGPIIREALEREVRRRLLEKIGERARAISKDLEHISDEEIAEIIRQYREGR